jgi:hypothetical protein
MCTHNLNQVYQKMPTFFASLSCEVRISSHQGRCDSYRCCCIISLILSFNRPWFETSGKIFVSSRSMCSNRASRSGRKVSAKDEKSKFSLAIWFNLSSSFEKSHDALQLAFRHANQEIRSGSALQEYSFFQSSP